MKLTHIIESKRLPDFLFHGSNYDFESFDKRKQGSSSDPGMRGRGFYFTDNLKTAKGYGKFVYTVRLDIKNPFIPTECNSIDDFIRKLGLETMLKNGGYLPICQVYSVLMLIMVLFGLLCLWRVVSPKWLGMQGLIVLSITQQRNT